MSETLTLRELLRASGHDARVGTDAIRGEGPVVGHVTHDSRHVEAGDVFVAVRGARDGADHAAEAVERGACAVVAASPDRRVGVPWIVVPDDREALAELAAVAWGRPSERIFVTGITGTNGKTTTSHMLWEMLAADGRKAGLVGTLEAAWPGVRRPARRTTPEAPELQGLLSEMERAGCTDAVLEVSSHALTLSRVRAMRFGAVGFTNLSHDHLDWHGDVEAYYQAKRSLFVEHAPAAPAAVVVDDDSGRRLAGELRRDADDRVVATCGFADDADLRVVDAQKSAWSSRFTLCASGRPTGECPPGWASLPTDFEIEIELKMPGRHNAQNAALAATLALLGGVSARAVSDALARFEGVPGRLEPVISDAGVRVFVDYAHGPGALEGVLSAAEELTEGRLICVFGCGGDRDREKRAPMARAAGAHADVVIATSDNPRSEDPNAILAQLERGLEGASAHCESVCDRRLAIARALELAEPGDVVVVAGKGHETTQEIAGQEIPFDDRQVIRQAWRELSSDRRRA